MLENHMLLDDIDDLYDEEAAEARRRWEDEYEPDSDNDTWEGDEDDED